MEKAHRFGTGMVSVANCGHLGAVGHFAMLATRQEMVGVCMTASSGGSRRSAHLWRGTQAGRQPHRAGGACR